MIQKEFNAISTGASGKFGNQVTLRIRGKRLIICKNRSASSVPPTENQLEVQSIFKRAAAYGRKVIKNLDLRRLYKAAAKEGASAYNAAVADYFQAPEIVEVLTTGYTGNVGEKILVDAKDNVRVAGVHVEIFTATGDLLESGEAVLPADQVEWSYAAQLENAAASGSRIVVTATDMPGNITVQEVVLA